MIKAVREAEKAMGVVNSKLSEKVKKVGSFVANCLQSWI